MLIVHRFPENLIEEIEYVFHALTHWINYPIQEVQLKDYFLNNNVHLSEDVQVNYRYDQVNVFAL